MPRPRRRPRVDSDSEPPTQRQYHHHRLSHRLLLLLLLVLLVTATAASSCSMIPRAATVAAFLPLHGGRINSRQQRGLASFASTAAAAATTAQSAPPKHAAPAPPKTLALGTEAGRALLKQVWGVESAADVRVVPQEEWKAAAERHRCVCV